MRVVLFGASGRFGRAIAQRIFAEGDLSLVEAIAHPASASLHQDLGLLTGSETKGLLISPACQKDADLFIDVSLTASFPCALAIALNAKRPIVIGSTGYSQKEMAQIRESAEQIPLFYASNFSLGIALFHHLAIEAARRFNPCCTADLFEAHHAKKKDTPSGFALALSKDLELAGKQTRVHSIRSGTIVGEHRLLLNSDDERLELSHTAYNRDSFARGALAAARFLQKQKPGLYGMDDLVLYLSS